jgi:hypothetical protein
VADRKLGPEISGILGLSPWLSFRVWRMTSAVEMDVNAIDL